MAMTAKEIISYMETLRDEKQREILMRFFKTAPGEYGYGDEFLGIKVPRTREVVRAAKDLALGEVPELLMSRWHEVRLCGLLILVAKFEKLATKRLENDVEAIHKRDKIVKLYLKYAERANNWDLVDLSVHKIIGHWLLLPTFLGSMPEFSPDGLSGVNEETDSKSSMENLAYSRVGEEFKEDGEISKELAKVFREADRLIKPDSNFPKSDEKTQMTNGESQKRTPSLNRAYKLTILDSLAQSPCLWLQRMSIVSSWKTSQQGDPSWCLRYAEIHLHHPHDLMHKAVGWMLREMGKRVSMDLLRDFLRQHAHEMPRTSLRYAIEKMSEQERRMWMAKPA